MIRLRAHKRLMAAGATAFTVALSSFALPAVADESKPAEAKAAAATAPAGEKRAYKDEAIKLYNHGHDLHQQGFFNQAITEYKAALAADDRMEEAYTNLGLIYAAQRNYSKAIDAFKRSLAINPNRPNALNGLGTVLYAKNRFNEAMEKWREAVKIDPNFASAHYNMGNALENEKDFKGAVENYVDALSIAPTMADAYYRIGSIYAKQKHSAQAEILLAKAIQLQPNGEFVHDAKKSLDSITGEISHDGAPEEPEVKMNIMAPPTDEAAVAKPGGI
jgi:tetratricopeptide (TPR) repeat protein